MSDTHNKLQNGNNYKHWKILDLVLDLNYFSFSNPDPNTNPTHLPKHQTLSPNHQCSQRFWYVEYYLCMRMRTRVGRSHFFRLRLRSCSKIF